MNFSFQDERTRMKKKKSEDESQVLPYHQTGYFIKEKGKRYIFHQEPHLIRHEHLTNATLWYSGGSKEERQLEMRAPVNFYFSLRCWELNRVSRMLGEVSTGLHPSPPSQLCLLNCSQIFAFVRFTKAEYIPRRFTNFECII